MTHPVLHVGRFARVTHARERFDGRTYTPAVWHTVHGIGGKRATTWGKRKDGSWWSFTLGPEWFL